MSPRQISEPVAHERARIASLTRSRRPDDPDLIEARRNLRAIRIEEYVRRTLADAPPLTDQQRARIAGLLAPADGGAA